MATASRRLALLLLPGEPEAPVALVEAGLAALRNDGWGEAGPRALVEGGCLPPAVEVVASGAVGFLSSGLGGFRVRCPVDGRAVVAPFNAALTRWRGGGERSLACPCGRLHDLVALDFAPPAAFARAAIRLGEVASVELAAGAEAVLGRQWGAHGGLRAVLRRG